MGHLWVFSLPFIILVGGVKGIVKSSLPLFVNFVLLMEILFFVQLRPP